MKIIKLSLLAFTLMVSACANTESPELKSPCVGVQGSPCDKRMPINNYV